MMKDNFWWIYLPDGSLFKLEQDKTYMMNIRYTHDTESVITCEPLKFIGVEKIGHKPTPMFVSPSQCQQAGGMYILGVENA